MSRFERYSRRKEAERKPFGRRIFAEGGATEEEPKEEKPAETKDEKTATDALEIYLDVIDNLQQAVEDNDEQALQDGIKNLVDQAASEFGAENIIPAPMWDEIAALTSQVATDVTGESVSKAVKEAVDQTVRSDMEAQRRKIASRMRRILRPRR